MAKENTSRVEEAISILSRIEKELDQITVRVSDMKKMLVNSAKEESEKAKVEVLTEVAKLAQKSLTEIEAEAKKEAEKILAQSEEELKSLRTKIDKSFQKAVSLVMKAALGE